MRDIFDTESEQWLQRHVITSGEGDGECGTIDEFIENGGDRDGGMRLVAQRHTTHAHSTADTHRTQKSE